MGSRHRTAGLFLVAATLTGGVYVANSAGLPHLPPVFFASLRFLVAAGVLLPYVSLRSTRAVPRTRTEYLTILASGGLVVGAANVFLFVGQQYTTSATAAVLVGFSPVLTVPLAAAVLPNERLTRRRVLGVILGFVGVGVVSQPSPAMAASTSIAGVGLVLLAASSLAVGGVVLRRLDGSLPPLAVTAWAMLVGGMTMLVLSFLRGEPIAAVRWPPVAVLAVGYNGLVATPVGYLAYFTLLDTVGPVRVNLLTYVSPVVSAVAGWALLGESLAGTTVVGFVTIAAGFALVEHRTLARELASARTALP